MKVFIRLLLASLFVLNLSGCTEVVDKNVISSPITDITQVPVYSGSPYVELNNNIPTFTKMEATGDSYAIYSDLDELGRCGIACAKIGKDLMPTEKRSSIGMIKPSGWHTVRYDDLVDGKYLYNRCHLIGYQLAGENANENDHRNKVYECRRHAAI